MTGDRNDLMTDKRIDELVEGIDFYREGPWIVFTEVHLRKKGYCCESGCRHCPWGYRPDQRIDVPNL